MNALVGAFNQEKALVGAFSKIVITGCGTDGSICGTSDKYPFDPAKVWWKCGTNDEWEEKVQTTHTGVTDKPLFNSNSGGVLGFWGGVWCLGIVFLLSLMMQRTSCRRGDSDRKKVTTLCRIWWLLTPSNTFNAPCSDLMTLRRHLRVLEAHSGVQLTQGNQQQQWPVAYLPKSYTSQSERKFSNLGQKWQK